jgi:hypothetical protein
MCFAAAICSGAKRSEMGDFARTWRSRIFFASAGSGLVCRHVPGRDHSHQTSGQAPEHDESQAAVERFAQCDVSPLARSPDLVITREDFLPLFRGELVPLDMEVCVAEVTSTVWALHVLVTREGLR